MHNVPSAKMLVNKWQDHWLTSLQKTLYRVLHLVVLLHNPSLCPPLPLPPFSTVSILAVAVIT